MADDDTYDNWEDLADSKDLDKTLEKKSEGMNATKKKKQTNQTTTNLLEGTPQYLGGEKSGIGGQIKILARPPVIIDENNTRTPPVNIPQMKILKRPEKSREELEKNEKKVCQQPVKTFAQREAEYNKARQRIMGSTGQESSSSSEQPAVKSSSNDHSGVTSRNSTDTSGGVAGKHGRYTNKNKNNHHHGGGHHHGGHHTSPNNHHQQHHSHPQHITGVTGANNIGATTGAAPSGGSVGYEPRRNNYYHKNSNGKGGYGR